MKLYPPVIDNKLPAFYGNSITIPFKLNITTSMGQVSGASILIKSVNNNDLLIAEGDQAFIGSINNDTVTFNNLSGLLKKNVSLTPGQFYKIQIAFCSEDLNGENEIGYYSNVGVAKYIHQPFMYIDELEQKDNILNNTYSYTGCYFNTEKKYEEIYNKILIVYNEICPKILKQSSMEEVKNILQNYNSLLEILHNDTLMVMREENLPFYYLIVRLYNTLNNYNIDDNDDSDKDLEILKQQIKKVLENDVIKKNFLLIAKTNIIPSQETLYDYTFTLYDSDKITILDTSGTCLNTNEENNDYITINTWQTFKYLKPYTNYYIQFSGTTLNGLKLSSRKYRIQTPDTIDLDIDADFIAKLDYENGCIDISLQPDSKFNSMIKYKFLISRASNKDNYNTWEPIMKDIKSFNFGDMDNADPNLEIEGIPNLHIWTDCTIEQGVSYIYALQAYNDHEIFSNRIYSNRKKITISEFEKKLIEYHAIKNQALISQQAAENFQQKIIRYTKTPSNIDIDAAIEEYLKYNSEEHFQNNLNFLEKENLQNKVIYAYGAEDYSEEAITQVRKMNGINTPASIIETFNNYINNGVIQYYKSLNGILTECINHFSTVNKDIYGDPIPVLADFEHAYLFDGERQLKLAFNPKVSSFKNTVLESKVDTLGGKYPFFFRNAKVKYKEFPISGLISCLMDPDDKFLTGVNQFQLKTYNDNGTINILDQYVGDTQLTSTNIYKERNFKMEVLEWLTNGQPKIFRSPTEGNFIIRLMNTSLSPNDTVGRMLHTFSSTAYEMADYTFDNLREYGFVDIDLTLKDNIVYVCQKRIEDDTKLIFDKSPKYLKCEITEAHQGEVELILNGTECIKFKGVYYFPKQSCKDITSISILPKIEDRYGNLYKEPYYEPIEIVWAYETIPPANNFNYIKSIDLLEETTQFIGGGNIVSPSEGVIQKDIVQDLLSNVEREIGQVNYLKIYRRHIENCWESNGNYYTQASCKTIETFQYADSLIYRIIHLNSNQDNELYWRDKTTQTEVHISEKEFNDSNPYQVILNNQIFTLESNEINSKDNENLLIYLKATKYMDTNEDYYAPITTETTIESNNINNIEKLIVGLGLNVEIEYYVKIFEYDSSQCSKLPEGWNTISSRDKKSITLQMAVKEFYEDNLKNQPINNVYWEKMEEYQDLYNNYINKLTTILSWLKDPENSIEQEASK